MAKKYTFPLSVTVERTDGDPVDEADVLSALKETLDEHEFEAGDDDSVFKVTLVAG